MGGNFSLLCSFVDGFVGGGSGTGLLSFRTVLSACSYWRLNSRFNGSLSVARVTTVRFSEGVGTISFLLLRRKTELQSGRMRLTDTIDLALLQEMRPEHVLEQ